jgi:hypothetical protein
LRSLRCAVKFPQIHNAIYPQNLSLSFTYASTITIHVRVYNYHHSRSLPPKGQSTVTWYTLPIQPSLPYPRTLAVTHLFTVYNSALLECGALQLCRPTAWLPLEQLAFNTTLYLFPALCLPCYHCLIILHSLNVYNLCTCSPRREHLAACKFWCWSLKLLYTYTFRSFQVSWVNS